MEKHNTTMRRWLNFCNILDKTVMGVLLRDECMKNECMVSSRNICVIVHLVWFTALYVMFGYICMLYYKLLVS